MTAASYWQQKWRENDIGFHHEAVNPFLIEYANLLDLNEASTVLVPLAGKSLDVAWLARQAKQVIAVELSELAVEQFFASQGLIPEVTQQAPFTLYSAQNIRFYCGDLFALPPEIVQQADALYDRAALIALDPAMRERYMQLWCQHLSAGCKILLLTMEYEQAVMAGPPFSVTAQMIQSGYARDFDITEQYRQLKSMSESHLSKKGLAEATDVVTLLQRKVINATS